MIKKTGNRRYRVETRWFGKPLVVLQIEYEKYTETMDWRSSSWESKLMVGQNFWEDAKPEDIMVIEGVK